MNQKYIDALKVGLAVAVLSAVGIGLFLYSGSMVSVVFFAIGVPALLAVGGIAYQRRVAASDSSGSPKLKSMARDLAADLESMLKTYNRLGRPPGENADRISEMGQELQNRGIIIHESEDSYRVSVEQVEMGPGAISQYRKRVESIRDGLVSDYTEYAELQEQSISEHLERLRSYGLIPNDEGVEQLTELQGADINELERILDNRRAAFREQVWEATSRISQTEGSADIDTQRVDELIEAGQFEDAVDIVLDTRVDVEEAGRERFLANKEELLSLIEGVRASAASQYCSASKLDKLREIETDVRSLDSVFFQDRLKENRQDTLRLCQDILDELQSMIVDYMDEFAADNVPQGYFERPSVLDRDFDSMLEQSSDLSNFTVRWTSAVSDVAEALKEAEARQGALVAYDDVVDDIDDILSYHGEVGGEDIPYNPPEHLMEIYSARHSDVTFLETESMLTHGSNISGKEFDLEVQIRLEPPENTDVVVNVETPTESRQRSMTVSGSDTCQFTSIRGGDVEVTATSESPEFDDTAKTVRLDTNQTVNLLLRQTSARERICGDLEEETRPLLAEVDADLSNIYQAEQYLHSGMELGVQPKYAPCLLALWADQEDLSLWETDDRAVFVFDRERLTNQLTNLFDQKLEEGGSMECSDIRERYLTFPAPDTLIGDIVGSEYDDGSVRVVESTVVKE